MNKTRVKHRIQKYILTQLLAAKQLRFRDMRPPRVDTNLYSYHLKLLQENGLVEKIDAGYRLTLDGLAYVHHSRIDRSTLPSVVAMVIVQDGYGGTLMIPKKTQPSIDQWALPFATVEIEDTSIHQAARRAVAETVGEIEASLSHAGDCYVRIRQDGAVKLSTLVHVFYGTTGTETGSDAGRWVAPHKISSLDLAPGVEQIVARAFFRDQYFFEEFDVDW